MIHPALPLAAILLAAAPGPAPDAPLVPMSKSLALAEGLGRSIGAAHECAMGDRADAAQKKAEELIDHQAIDDDEDPIDMNDHFREAMEDGRDAVLDNTMSCAEAETAIKQLEGDQRY